MSTTHGGTRPTTSGRRLRGLAAGLLLATVPFLGACAEEGPDPEIDGEETASVELSASELGEIGGRIYSDPERAEAILDDAGLTSEEFEARVREITNDPLASREYTLAFEDVIAEPADGAPAEDGSGAEDTGAGPAGETTPGAAGGPDGSLPRS